MDENRIYKPLTIAREDFYNQLVELINTSDLPYFVITYILQEIVQICQHQSLQQLQMDSKIYEEALHSKAEKVECKEVDEEADTEVKEEIDIEKQTNHEEG